MHVIIFVNNAILSLHWSELIDIGINARILIGIDQHWLALGIYRGSPVYMTMTKILLGFFWHTTQILCSTQQWQQYWLDRTKSTLSVEVQTSWKCNRHPYDKNNSFVFTLVLLHVNFRPFCKWYTKMSQCMGHKSLDNRPERNWGRNDYPI